MNLILLTNDDRAAEDRFELRDNRAEHIRSVLKASVGDLVEVGLVNGTTATATVTAISGDAIGLQVDAWTEPEPIAPSVDLIVALPRPQTLKKVLFACGMMGVRRLDLVRANRVERSYYQSPLLEEHNLRAHLVDGMSQGKLTRLPEVTIHQRFRPFFEDELPRRDQAEPGALKLVPHPETESCLNTMIPDTIPDPLWIAIGPEGGWVPFELELMQQQGFRPVTLGRRVLRVEHAVVAVLSQLELLRLREDR